MTCGETKVRGRAELMAFTAVGKGRRGIYFRGGGRGGVGEQEHLAQVHEQVVVGIDVRWHGNGGRLFVFVRCVSLCLPISLHS